MEITPGVIIHRPARIITPGVIFRPECATPLLDGRAGRTPGPRRRSRPLRPRACAGAPICCASTPVVSAPQAMAPMNTIAYRLVTRPRSSCGMSTLTSVLFPVLATTSPRLARPMNTIDSRRSRREGERRQRHRHADGREHHHPRQRLRLLPRRQQQRGQRGAHAAGAHQPAHAPEAPPSGSCRRRPA